MVFTGEHHLGFKEQQVHWERLGLKVNPEALVLEDERETMVRMVPMGETALLDQPDLKETPVHKALGVQQVHRDLKETLVHKARKANPAYQGGTTRLPLKL